MNLKPKSYVQKLTLAAILIALATVLSLIKVFKAPLGGSVTLLSMLPIAMISSMLGIKWGLASAFVYSLIQLALGISLDGLLGWGLTPVMLIGTIILDYVLAFTVLGFSGIFAKKGVKGVAIGTGVSVFARFLCHFISGFIIFKELSQFEVFGQIFQNKPILYSLCYNGLYMLPELVITVIFAVILFNIKPIKRLIY